MKVVYFCLKINVKFVLYRNFFLLYDFLSLEYLRLAGSIAVFACARLAQLARELIAHKNLIEERNIFVKQILHWFLCINKQLLFIQVFFISIWNPPYYEYPHKYLTMKGPRKLKVMKGLLFHFPIMHSLFMYQFFLTKTSTRGLATLKITWGTNS